MSIEQNKALVRRLVDEVFNQGDMAAADAVLAADFVEHEELPPGTPPGREGPKALTQAIRGAFPDFHVTIEEMIAEGDKVFVRTTWTGTQEGEFMGIPAAGGRMNYSVWDVMRVADGRFVEHWGLSDNMTMMQQLGAMPGPE